MPVRYKTDFDKFVVQANFERRGWECVDDYDDGWDIYWASVGTVKNVFGADSGTRLQHGQLISHFPNHYELTRKVCLCVKHTDETPYINLQLCLHKYPHITWAWVEVHTCSFWILHVAQDLMVKNIKRFQKQVRREGKPQGLTQDDLDIIPATFVLPQVGGGTHVRLGLLPAVSTKRYLNLGKTVLLWCW